MGLLSSTRRVVRCRWCGGEFLWGKLRVPFPLRWLRSEPGICTACASQLVHQMSHHQHKMAEDRLLVPRPREASRVAG